MDEQLTYEILTECKNDLLKFYDFEQTNETDFIQMYQNSISKWEYIVKGAKYW